MNVHDEVEPRKVLKSSGQKNLQFIFAKYSKRNFCRSSKKGQRQTRGARMDIYIFYFMYLKQFHNSVQHHQSTCTYVYEKEKTSWIGTVTNKRWCEDRFRNKHGKMNSFTKYRYKNNIVGFQKK